MIPSFIGVFVTGIMLNIFAIPIGLINFLIWDGANYMYLCEKPPVSNPMLIGEWPMYIFSLEIIGLMIFAVLLIPFEVRKYFK